MKIHSLTFVFTLIFTAFHYWLFSAPALSLGFAFLIFFLIHQGLKVEHLRQQEQTIQSQMYFFMQMFLTTLAIKKTVHESFLDVYDHYQQSKQPWLQAYGSNDPLHVLINLQQRFHHPLYGIFVLTIRFYEDHGGNVFILFESLLRQLRLVETRRMDREEIRKRSFFQWLLLWVLNLIVLMMAKVVLLDLFQQMMTSWLFIGLLTVMLVYFPISYLFWLKTFSNAGDIHAKS